MELETKIEQQIKELQGFVAKQKINIEANKRDISKMIDSIDDKEMKSKMSIMLSEAMKGNIDSVQKLAKQMQQDVEVKQK